MRLDVAIVMLSTYWQHKIVFCSHARFYILKICVLGISLAVFPLRAVLVFPGLVHVGDELREVNGNLITHKRPDEISQILVINVGSV